MKKISVILLAAGLMAGCGGASNTASNGANSVVNAMNSNAKNMPGTNNNTGYVMNSNSTSPPSMPSNATNISPPSANHVTGGNNSNSHSNTKNTNK
jgi:hypothetical protein